MNRRVWGATLAVLGAVVAVAPPAGAEVAGWKLSLLPLPPGHEDATGYVTGTDGRGGYSGHLQIGDSMQVVTWTADRPEVRGTPPGTEFAATADQNQAGVIAGSALDHETGDFLPFTLDDAGFRLLPLPDGHSDGWATAINEHGDVVGSASGDVVLWPADGDPQVLKVDLPSVSADDIDDDGTILLNSDAGPYLWRDGTLTGLAHPAEHNYPQALAIKNGWVAGTASSATQPGSTGFLWCAPDEPTTCQGGAIPLPRGASAHEINSALLVVGRELTGAVHGPLAVWRGDQYLARLEVPAGQLGSAGALAEDGTVAGWVNSTGDPSDGGRPAVWLPAR